MTSEAEIKAAIREWIVQHAKQPPGEIREDSRLIEDRIITSIQILDLVLFIEELRGAPIEASQLKPGAFLDIATLYEVFFGAVP